MPNHGERSFKFIGPLKCERTVISSSLDLLSTDNVHMLIRRAWLIGRYQLTSHFKTRARDRGFDVLDVENAIQFGKLSRAPEYCSDFKNWKCQIVGPAEERNLEIVVAIDDLEDYDESPLIIPITGYWKD